MSQSDTEKRQQPRNSEKAGQGSVRTYGRWQLFYLDRLHHLCELSRNVGEDEVGEEKMRILKRAIFSTLLDCDAAGVGDEARKIFAEQKAR